MRHQDLDEDLRGLIAGETRQDLSGIDGQEDLMLKLGIDSLSGLNLLAAVEERFDVVFANDRLADLRTLDTIRDAIIDAKGDV